MRQVLLLRGVNVGGRNRLSMADLREALGSSPGLGEVRTYVQSGNVILSSGMPPEDIAVQCRDLIEDRFGLSIDVLARTRDDLAEVVDRNPLADVVTEPKRYQVSFCSAPPDGAVIERLRSLAAGPERLVAAGRELYAWHPEGVARSKLWAELAGRKLGVRATARNWKTVTTLLAMADE